MDRNVEKPMMSDNDLSKKLSEISQDTKSHMAEANRPSRAVPSGLLTGNTWSMWPMYLCLGVLFVLLIYTLIPRGG